MTKDECRGCTEGVFLADGYHWVPGDEERDLYCYPCPTEKAEPTPQPELTRCMIKRLKFGPGGQ